MATAYRHHPDDRADGEEVVVLRTLAQMHIKWRSSRSLAWALVAALTVLACEKTETPNGSTPPIIATPAAPPVVAVVGKAEVTDYVGSSSCQSCHANEFEHWTGSHHQLAMQVASSDTVLGDFANHPFNYFGERSRFQSTEDTYAVKTEGTYRDKSAKQTGQRSFDVRYTFGVEPLQQYLVDAGKGHLQALPFCFDTRKKTEGGQRWYHLYENEHVPMGDALHWTGPLQKWNISCADCHSTNLQKNYDASNDSYQTKYSEVSVGCEACHGPGSAHVEQAKRIALGKGQFGKDKGLLREFSTKRERQWLFAENKNIAQLADAESHAARTQTQLSACAKCHSRRSDLGGDSLEFDERYRLELLQAQLYFADGQIQDEVYVHGSFIQSKMHSKGVVCGDCHQPHSGKLRASGNQLCSTCHRSQVYDTPKHHFHPSSSDGAKCVSCHMPSRVYMGIDARRDHRIGVPRPDLSVSLGVPNACTTGCHAEQVKAGQRAADRWAEQQIETRFGNQRPPSFAPALHAARAGLPGGKSRLANVITDASQPAVVRATALLEMRNYPPVELRRWSKQARDRSPLVRRAFAELAGGTTSPNEHALLLPLLKDKVRSVRLEAAQGLIDADAAGWTAAQRKARKQTLDELRAALEHNNDQPAALLGLARIELSALRPAQPLSAQATAREQPPRNPKAEALFTRALRLDPTHTPTYANFADYWRTLGDNHRAEVLLKTGIEKAGDPAQLEHSLGLTLVRLKRPQLALPHLAKAFELRPDLARFGFVYAVALWDQKQQARALTVLESVHQRFAGDRQVVSALIQYHRLAGNSQRAAELMARLPSGR